MSVAAKKDGSGVLFDNLIAANDLKNDAGLARALGLYPATISKVRHLHIAVGPALILNIHETFDTPVADIRKQLAGEPA